MIQSMGEAYRATAPHSFAYVISRDATGKVNVMGASWWTFVSSNPATLLVCLSRKKHTIHNITKTREFSLCLPDLSLREQAKKICACSGATVDKIAEFGLELQVAREISVPVLKAARARFECRLREIADGGDHAICIADIVAYSTDETLEKLCTQPTGYAL